MNVACGPPSPSGICHARTSSSPLKVQAARRRVTPAGFAEVPHRPRQQANQLGVAAQEPEERLGLHEPAQDPPRCCEPGGAAPAKLGEDKDVLLAAKAGTIDMALARRDAIFHALLLISATHLGTVALLAEKARVANPVEAGLPSYYPAV